VCPPAPPPALPRPVGLGGKGGGVELRPPPAGLPPELLEVELAPGEPPPAVAEPLLPPPSPVRADFCESLSRDTAGADHPPGWSWPGVISAPPCAFFFSFSARAACASLL